MSFRGKIVLLLTIMQLFLWSCESKNDKFRGEVVISSAFNFNLASLRGFSFSTEEYVNYPSTGDSLPDILVENIRDAEGNISPGLASPANDYGFHLVEEFASASETLDFFNNTLLRASTDVNFISRTDTIQSFQVWILKTMEGAYVKFAITDIQKIPDPSGEHFEIWLSYHYQPDGTAEFPL